MLILSIRYRDMIFRIKGSFDEVMEFLCLWKGRSVREFVTHMGASCV